MRRAAYKYKLAKRKPHIQKMAVKAKDTYRYDDNFIPKNMTFFNGKIMLNVK